MKLMTVIRLGEVAMSAKRRPQSVYFVYVIE